MNTIGLVRCNQNAVLMHELYLNQLGHMNS